MSDLRKSVVSFDIDDTPSKEQSSQAHSEEYEIGFHEFISRTTNESAEEDFTYSNQSVRKAGRRLRKQEGDLKSATETIQTFRAAHDKPLKTIAYLIGRCCRELGIPVKPVKRLKRLGTIIDKLQRKSLDGKTTNATCVTNMNDIGGCRAIFPNIDSLNQAKQRLLETIEREARVRIKDIDDYITEPKPNDCGYRSLHIIYQYNHSSGKNFNIEAQLRTRLQHLWATTVEIIDILEQTKIKTHSHSPDSDKTVLQVKWEELLFIMSQYIADAERAIILSSCEKKAMAQRLSEINNSINAVTKLQTFQIMSKEVDSCCDDTTKYILLTVDEKTRELVSKDEFSDQATAIFIYNEVEKLTQSLENINTVLISTKNMGQLKEAYPNYLGDCSSFIKILNEAMSQ